ETVDDDEASLLARRLFGQPADARDDCLRPDMVRFGGVVGVTRGARHLGVRAKQARSNPAMHQGEDNLTPIPTCMTVSLCHIPPLPHWACCWQRDFPPSPRLKRRPASLFPPPPLPSPPPRCCERRRSDSRAAVTSPT